MACQHESVRVAAERAFSGPVSRDEDRRAHGNITQVERCDACGAERAVNVNQLWREEGDWGASRAERQAAAARAARDADKLAAELAEATATVRHGDGRQLTLSIDADGYVVARGSTHTEAEAEMAVSSWPGGLAAAARLRTARALAAELASDVR